MKLLLLSLAVLLALSGCSGRSDPPTQTTPTQTTATTVQTTTTTTPAALPLPEGSVPVEDAAALERETGLLLPLPALAQEAAYYLLEGGCALVTFTFEGTQYHLTVGKDAFDSAPEGLTEVHEEAWVGYPYTLRLDGEGAGCALWEDALQSVECCLTAVRGTDHDRLKELAVMLLPAG